MAYGSRVVRDHEKKMMVVSSRYGGWSQRTEKSTSLTSSVKQRERTGNSMWLWKLKATPPGTSSSSKVILPKPTQTVPLTGVKYSDI